MLKAQPIPNASASLDDKWTKDRGRVVMSGTQAVVRVMMAQRQLDARAGLRTTGYITGYRGAPFGNVDMTLWSLGKRLEGFGITFQPGLNEEIAATAICGTQQLDFVPGAKHDGVFAAWYAKGVGAFRSGDAFKHGNTIGAHRKGGVLIFYGDDHAGKSSTVSHQSEPTMAAQLIPSLYPSNAQEILEFGLFGYALSRFSGSWVAIKCVGEVAEQTATVDLELDEFPIVLPEMAVDNHDVNARIRPYNPIADEQRIVDQRLPRVAAFVKANPIDKVRFLSDERLLGIVTAGKAFGDVRAALHLLGLDDKAASSAGISLYKLGCIWPVEPDGMKAFSKDHRTLFVIEEKRDFIEQQIAALIVNMDHKPRLVGKRDEAGELLLSSVLPLEARGLALAIADRLDHLGRLSDAVRARRDALRSDQKPTVAEIRRSPYFCSGCPHSRSTQLPDGSLSMTGTGCHAMAMFGRPETALQSMQMGGEGANWIGLSPFTEVGHIFQNMGEGTYYHSGLIAIRAAIAAGVNITYKILYNDAVAMTGGQPVDGPLSVAQIVRQVRDEGVQHVVILSDDPGKYRSDSELPKDVRVLHREKLDEVQRELRETPGCTVLVYEQTCAAEKRRRRKRGSYPNPSKRLFIAKEVCEGCGDCSVQSTCVSLMPAETPMGRKRAIDQSSCNKDFSCLDGFCPSFLTVYGAEPRKADGVQFDEAMFDDLPEPERAPIGKSFNLMVAGIGGTGVITVGALIGMAAHLEGLAISSYDMTGLSQKNGAVFSHLRIARTNDDILTPRLSHQEADTLLAFDLVAALMPESRDTLALGRTRAIVNMDVAPTFGFQFDRDQVVDTRLLQTRLTAAVGEGRLAMVNAAELATVLLGDSIGANLFLTGLALQRGLLPIGARAIERAVTLNGVAVDLNLRAFRLGRLYAVHPDDILDLVRSAMPPTAAVPDTLEAVIEHRALHLAAYQDSQLAQRYRSLVMKVRDSVARVAPGDDRIPLAVARNYAKLLAYKDEYEVARLLTSETLRTELATTFCDGGRIALNLAPPFWPTSYVNGRPKKREFGQWILPVLKVMARFRAIRGTVLDPFGYTVERRQERALISEYEGLVEEALARLAPDTVDDVLALLDGASEIRGFGPVKEQAVHFYRERTALLLEALEPSRVPVAKPVRV